MYKTEITTREDIEKAISVVPKGFEDTTAEGMCTSSLLMISPANAELVVNTLEICANKFPDKEQ